jgi:hypothetical protein
MKKTIFAATFVALGAGTLSAGALNDINIKGSDTLFAISSDIIARCPGANQPPGPGLSYVGGGSGAGETAIVAGTQTVAPMSRFLVNNTTTNNVCNHPNVAQAEGIGFAADGLSVFVNKVHRTACDPASEAEDCSASTTPDTGLAYSDLATPVQLQCGITIANWREVLKLVYFGLRHSDGDPPALVNNAVNTGLRDCLDPCRVEILNNWGKLFENNCSGAAGNCTQLHRAFRRDENSGTTDVFRFLVRANPEASTGSNGYPFCNEYVPGVDPVPACPAATVGGTLAGAPGLPTPPFFENFQDSDPVRRNCITSAACDGTGAPFPEGPCEQVCGMRGNLGVVIPQSIPETNSTVPVGQTIPDTDRYAKNPCTNNRRRVQAARITAVPARWALCPNGDMPNGAVWNPTTRTADGGPGTCTFPVDANNDPRCLNGRTNRVALFNPPPQPILSECTVTLFQQDGRVYNLHPHKADGSYLTQTYAFNGVAADRQTVGAFHRIHTTRTAQSGTSSFCGASAAANEYCCHEGDATRNIACLVGASPCSIGFAGREGADIEVPTNGGVKGVFSASLQGVSPLLDSCVVTGAYPMSRAVYLNTLIGFEAVTGEERELARCFAGQGLSFLPPPAPQNFAQLVEARNFIAITPFCNDFNQSICPGSPANTDACLDNTGGIPNVDNPLVP